MGYTPKHVLERAAKAAKLARSRKRAAQRDKKYPANNLTDRQDAERQVAACKLLERRRQEAGNQPPQRKSVGARRRHAKLFKRRGSS